MVQSGTDAAITSSDDALIILASDGASYAVPLAALDQWRLPGEVTTRLREEHAVAGYGVVPSSYQALGVLPLAQLPRVGFDGGGGLGFDGGGGIGLPRLPR